VLFLFYFLLFSFFEKLIRLVREVEEEKDGGGGGKEKESI
jgi:hypothetical protein